MLPYVIVIDGNLTSYVFFNDLLKKLHEFYMLSKRTQVIFDFSKVKSIDPLVIPNLLCVGYTIRETTGFVPDIFISNTLSNGYLKRYLHEIKFIHYANEHSLFSFSNNIFGGWSDSSMDKLNTTIFFDKEESEQESWAKILYHTQKFINKFLTGFNSYSAPENLILELTKEIVENAKDHGESFLYMTIQYNYTREKVYLAYSDCGNGFFQTIKKQKPKVSDELSGIIEGIFSRYGKPYGLYSVIKKSISNSGIIRIHSNNTQMILTENMRLEFECAKNADDFRSIILADKYKNNIRKDLKVQGVHIEIELPLKRKEINSNV